ncbi:MAG: urea ABC transporter permease subunit UrtB [Bacteroidales bacterium]|nr:urea ABC transporter permease subunit UrtB [Bacteroidales bacterium]
MRAVLTSLVFLMLCLLDIVPAAAQTSGADTTQVAAVPLTRAQKRELALMNNLHSQQADVRISAYRTLSARRDSATLALLSEALVSEQDAAAKEVADMALQKVLLFVGTSGQQYDAIQKLGELPIGEGLPLLQEYVGVPALDPGCEVAARNAIKALEHKQKNIDGIQNIFSGLSLGSILILVALGLSIIYGLAHIINMAHGEFMMIGAYTTYCMQLLFQEFLPASWFDAAWFLSLPISFAVSALFGLAIERLVIRHLYSRPLESLLATWGISLILIQLARTIFGDLTTVKSPLCLSGGITFDNGIVLPYNRLFIMALTAIVFLGVMLVFQKTRLGMKIRAVTQNRNMAACVGISTKRIDMLTFAIGSGLAGLAGCAITLIGNVVPDMGQTYIVDSFIVVVTGGVGKLFGCVVSGLGIGILSKIFESMFEAVYGKVLILLFVIIFLQKRPQGLFRDKGRVAED